MEQVMYARGQEPWRIEFMQLEELKEESRKEGYDKGREAQLAADKTEIAQRDSEIAALKAHIAQLEASAAAN